MSHERIIEEAEKIVEKRLSNSLKGRFIELEPVMRGEKKYSPQLVEQMVEDANKDVRLYFGDNDASYEDYKFTNCDGKVTCGEAVKKNCPHPCR